MTVPTGFYGMEKLGEKTMEENTGYHDLQSKSTKISQQRKEGKKKS